MSVVYNFLNLPRQMLWSDAGTGAEKIINILYDAKGRKLRKTVTDNTTLLYRQDYAGNLEYRFTTSNGLQPEAAYFRDGRVYYNAGTWRYEYYLKDHLGNIRLTFTDKNNNGVVDVNNTANNEILQENHYYPFGMDQSGPWMNDAALDNAYKYNGKELHTDFGLGWYAYEARWYDPQVGRFPGVDPIIEKFAYLTPYNYASNSPVSKIDLYGLQGVYTNELEFGPKEGEGNAEPLKAMEAGLKWVYDKIVEILPDQGDNVPVGKNEIDSNLPGKGNEMLTGNPKFKSSNTGTTLVVEGGADKIYTAEDLGFLPTGGGVLGDAVKAFAVPNAIHNLGDAISRAVDAKKEYDNIPQAAIDSAAVAKPGKPKTVIIEGQPYKIRNNGETPGGAKSYNIEKVRGN